MAPPLPMTASHEGAGIVTALGSNVTNFSIGDRVLAGITYKPCGNCNDCTTKDAKQDYIQYCPKAGGFCGLSVPGYFAEYAVADATQSVKLPASIPFTTAAPLACAGVTVWRAIALANLSKGQTLGIVGSGGGLGHLAIQFSKALGLKVVGIDARDEGLDVSKKFGADTVVDARNSQDQVVKQVQHSTDGHGTHATLNLSDSPSAAGLACAITRMHGTMFQVAAPEKNVSIPYEEFVFRDIKVRGSLISGPNEARAMLDVVAKHGIRAETNVFEGLESIGEVMDLVHGEKMKGKAVIVVDGALK